MACMSPSGPMPARLSPGFAAGSRLRARCVHMPAGAAAQTAVVIPARDEEDRIEKCLRALARQRCIAPSRFFTVLVANNCEDATIDRALAFARESVLALCVIDYSTANAGSAGLARHIGCSAALSLRPNMASVLTTDADCIVDELWVNSTLRHLRSADAVCGKVIPDADEAVGFPAHFHKLAAAENRYWTATLEFLHLVDPDPSNPWPHHGQAAGASLAFRSTAYRSIGGFSDVVCGEDRDIVRSCKQAGLRVVHADDVKVTASRRLFGRAKGGMADTIRHRVAHGECWVDAALSPARLTMSRALAAAVGSAGSVNAGPSLCPRLRFRNLPAEIDRLSHANRVLRSASHSERMVHLAALVETA